MPTIHLIITGKVQGVFFRATAKKNAEAIGVNGWIKNTPDGNVELMATAPEYQLQHFIRWCKKGPPGSQVTNVAIEERVEESFKGFTIRR